MHPSFLLYRKNRTVSAIQKMAARIEPLIPRHLTKDKCLCKTIWMHTDIRRFPGLTATCGFSAKTKGGQGNIPAKQA